MQQESHQHWFPISNINISCVEENNKIVLGEISKSETTIATEEMSIALDDFTNEILNLKLNQKTLNSVFKSSASLLKKLQQFNDQLIKNDNGMNSSQALAMATNFVCEKIEKVNSQYKRNKMYESNENYVAPQEFSVGLRYETTRDFPSLEPSLKLVPCKYQYVSLIETLKSLFNRNDFFSEYMKYNSNHIHQKGVYKDFRDGKVYESNKLFQSHPNSVQIQIGWDDFEVCNPLGAKKTLHKICAVYFTVWNMPKKFLSKSDNIFLLCLATSDDLKTQFTDFNDILRPIVKELAHLEKYGIDINLYDGSSSNLKGTLASITYDNLGGNTCLGLVEGFRTTSSYCRICVLKQAECKKMCTEDEVKLRNKEMYEKQLKIVENSTEVDYEKSEGVKRYCVLNDLSFFDIFVNINADIMHDVNEGVISFLLNDLFDGMVAWKVLTKKKIEDKIKFYDYGFLCSDRAPTTINVDKKNLSLSASQIKCLLQHVPFIFYDELQNIHMKEIWCCVESLLVITQIVYSSIIDEDDLELLRNNVQIHLESSINFFKTALKPKHHFLTHYERILRQMGPLKDMSMFKYERKHKILKEISKNTRNFTNINKTIATVHQQNMARVKNSFEDAFTVGSGSIVKHDFVVDHKNVLLTTFNCIENITEMQWIKFNDRDYRRGLFIYHTNLILEIEKILCVGPDFYFFCIQFDYVSYHKFANSIKIKCSSPSIYKIIKFDTEENVIVFEKKNLNEDT